MADGLSDKTLHLSSCLNIMEQRDGLLSVRKWESKRSCKWDNGLAIF